MDATDPARRDEFSPRGSVNSDDAVDERRPTDWWVVTPREKAPQWSLRELFALTAGAAVASAIARVVNPQIEAALLGTVVLIGWLRLHFQDWEPRWAVVAWRIVLVAYLTSVAAVVITRL